MSRYTVRDKIVAPKNAGVSVKEVMKQLKVCRKTVFNEMKRYHQTDTTVRKPIPGRSRSARTNATVKAIKKREQRNPCRSLHQTAKSLQFSERSVRRVFKEDLGVKPYQMQRRHLISAASKTKRRNRAKMMLEEMERAGDRAFIWSDENIFTVQAGINSQNDRV